MAGDGDKREAGRQIMKNRGLTRERKKVPGGCEVTTPSHSDTPLTAPLPPRFRSTATRAPRTARSTAAPSSSARARCATQRRRRARMVARAQASTRTSPTRAASADGPVAGGSAAAGTVGCGPGGGLQICRRRSRGHWNVCLCVSWDMPWDMRAAREIIRETGSSPGWRRSDVLCLKVKDSNISLLPKPGRASTGTPLPTG